MDKRKHGIDVAAATFGREAVEPIKLVGPLGLVGDEIVIEAADARDALRARQVLAATAQFDFDVFALGDVLNGAEQTDRLSFVVALEPVFVVENPFRSIGSYDAEIRLRHGLAGDDRLPYVRKHLPVFGMDQAGDEFDRMVRGLSRDAPDAQKLVRPFDFVCDEITLEAADACNSLRQLQILAAAAQRALALLPPGHVAENGNQHSTLGRCIGACVDFDRELAAILAARHAFHAANAARGIPIF